MLNESKVQTDYNSHSDWEESSTAAGRMKIDDQVNPPKHIWERHTNWEEESEIRKLPGSRVGDQSSLGDEEPAVG